MDELRVTSGVLIDCGSCVLVRGCGMMPGGVDGDLGLVLLEGTLRGAAGGGWEGVAANVGGVVVYTQPAWVPPAPASDDAETAGGTSGGGAGAGQGTSVRTPNVHEPAFTRSI